MTPASLLLLFLLLLLLKNDPGYAQGATPCTLLYLGQDGLLRMANVSEKEARLPKAPLLPGRRMRRLAVSPDGTRALLEGDGSNGQRPLWVLHLDSRRVLPLGTDYRWPDGAANPFSPDGKRIALRRYQEDRVDVFWATTGRRYQTLNLPGLQELPAWFGDSVHLAAPVQRGDGGSTLWILHSETGVVENQTLTTPDAVRYRFASSQPGLLVYRQTQAGIDLWWSVRVDGTTELTIEPEAPKVAPDLPEGVEGSPSPNGEWVAYLQVGGLCVRFNVEGAEAVRLADAKAFCWKPGPALAEQAVVPRPGASAVASVPGILTLQVLPTEAVEGEPLEITWQAGPQVTFVRLSAYLQRTPKGGIHRGTLTIPIARVAASLARYAWPVPWLDNIRFTLRAEALDSTLRPLARVEQALSFRPKELANEWRDGLFIHLSDPKRQRLYVQEGGQITMVMLCSGSSTGQLLPPHLHPDAPHDHYGTFTITAKDPDHVSNLDPTWKMPYAMRYLAGHWIHVTARNQYHRLGGPGSHGCIRLHHADGARLYQRTKIGEMVVIY